jgi:hypothetical protein
LQQQQQNNTTIMVRSSLPTNPFRWKKKLLRKGSDQSTIEDDQTRKISIDQTILSSNSSLHEFSRSCDIIDGLPTDGEDLSNNFAANATASGIATATAIPTQIKEQHNMNMTTGISLSVSEPSFPSYDMNNYNVVPLPRSYEQQEQLPLHQHIAVGMPISPQQWYMPCSTSQRPQVSDVPPRSPQQSTSKPHRDPALEARLDAIKIQEQLLGENHPDVIFALSSLAKLYQKRGYHVDAASLLKESKTRSRSHSAPQLYPQENSNVPTEITFSHLS